MTEHKNPTTQDPYAVWREIDDIIQQLEWCNYECEAGSLENNVAFQRLKQIVMQAFMRDD